MRVHFTETGWNEYLSWQEDTEVSSKVVALIQEVRRTPFTGTGKPEPLKNLSRAGGHVGSHGSTAWFMPLKGKAPNSASSSLGAGNITERHVSEREWEASVTRVPVLRAVS